MYRPFSCRHIILLLSAVSATAVAAAQPSDTLSGGVLESAAISAARRDIPVVEGVYISRYWLDAAGDVSDALRNAAGIQVKDYGGVGGLKTVNIRSLGSEHTAVFIDGIPVDNAQNAQVDFGRFSADAAGGLYVSAGHSGFMLQTARECAAAGSVNMITALPEFSDRRKTACRLRLKAGSFGTVAPALTFDCKVSPGTTFRANAEFTSADGCYKFHSSRYFRQPDGTLAGYDTVMTRLNGDLSAIRAEAVMIGGEVSRWKAHAYYYDSERGLPGPVVRTADMLPGYGDRQSDRDFFVQGSWERPFSGSFRKKLSVKGKYAHNYTRYRTDPEKNPQSMPVDVTYRQNTAYVSLAGAVQPSSGIWSAGLSTDIQYNSLDADSRFFARPERFSFWGAASGRLLRPRVMLSAAAVYSLFSDWFDNSLAGAFSRENKLRQDFSPSLLFRIMPWAGSGRRAGAESLAVEGFVKRTCRMPSFNDLYYTFVGNSSLRDERAFQADVGLRYGTDAGRRLHLDAKADFYHNVVTDKIIAIPTSSLFRWTMFNVGKVSTLGADAIFTAGYRSIDHKGTGTLTLRYTWQRSLDVSDPEGSGYGGQIPYIPEHSGSVTASWSRGGWRADFMAVFTGERWSSSANYADYHIDPWWTCDLRFSKKFAFRNISTLKVSLDIRNLLNEQYEVVQSYPMPGVNVLARAEYCF